MKSTEDHLRELLAERASHVQPGPVPEHLLREVPRSRRTGLAVALAAAAVVAIAAVAALLGSLGGTDPHAPAPAASGSGSPTPSMQPSPTQSPTSLLPATSRFPAAGVCGRTSGQVLTVMIEPDTPNPRCASVHAGQSLRVVNRTGDFGQHAHTVTVTWIPGHPFTLRPGESKTFPQHFGDYLARGVHQLKVNPAYVAEVWLR